MKEIFNKTTRTARGFVLSGIVLMGGFLLYRFSESSGPYYHNRPLRFWVQELPISAPVDPVTPSRFYRSRHDGPADGRGPESGDLASVAIRSLGTNALPFLVSWLAMPNRNWRDTVLTWAEALNISTIVARGNDAIRWKVVTAFQILGTNASGALPRLELLCNNQDLAVSSAAKLAVQRIRASSFQTGSVLSSKNTPVGSEKSLFVDTP